MSAKRIRAVDMFCGAGGTTSGLAQACAELGIGLELLAINHWQVAIDTHSTNHTWAEHRCESIDNVDPRKAVPGGRLKLLVASPECCHHSNARGGRPMSDQSRASAWAILRWAEALYIDNILVENVREFMTWGPLGASGRPLRSKRGLLFEAFINSLKVLGYAVDWRVLNAADYGDPTTRERLFVLARRGGKKIVWPEPTHTSDPQPGMFDQRRQWRAAREIIDWSVPGESIFTRKRPLADAPLARIAAGLRKFGGAHAEPFLVVLRRNQNARSLDKPLPTMTTSGANFALCEPFVLQQQSGGSPRSVSDPLPTVATKGAIGLVEPFLVRYQGSHKGKADGNGRVHSVEQPLPVQDTSNRYWVVSPFIVPFFGERAGQEPRCHSVDAPLPAVTSHGAGALVEPFITDLRGADRPKAPRSVDDPVPTITTHNGLALVKPFLVEYHSNGSSKPVTQPLGTITTKDRFGLVETDGGKYAVDIRFRMLQPHELAAAMGFPKDYQFAGTREQRVKQIGNAVAVQVAKALCREMLQ